MSFIDTASITLAQQRLNVIGKNIANANTVGYKASTFNQTLASTMFVHAGIGEAGSTQDFSQATVTGNNSPLNMAISGNGLFQLDRDGITTYTRDGQFSMNKEGNIASATGEFLTGYNAVNGIIKPLGITGPLMISTGASKPVATGMVTMGLILNSLSYVVDPAVTPFSPANASSYTHTSTSNIYDALGNPHTLQSYYTNTGITSAAADTTWEVHTSIDGGASNFLGTMVFDSSGALTQSSDAVGVATAKLGMYVDATTISTATGQKVSLDLANSVQYGTSFGAISNQDGFPSGQVVGLSVETSGIISVHYSTGNSLVVGQVVLASFKNLNGLAQVPNNQWSATSASGVAMVGTPDSTAAGLGVLAASAVEDSNVDLVSEMVNMISAQRIFQAQSSVIKTEDQNLQTIVALKQ